MGCSSVGRLWAQSPVPQEKEKTCCEVSSLVVIITEHVRCGQSLSRLRCRRGESGPGLGVRVSSLFLPPQQGSTLLSWGSDLSPTLALHLCKAPGHSQPGAPSAKWATRDLGGHVAGVWMKLSLLHHEWRSPTSQRPCGAPRAPSTHPTE